MKGFMISGAMTGAGKTTVTLGLLAAMKKRGIAVQPFKVGPDFIDPGLHSIAAGVPSHNLDGWMLSRETNEWLFATACAGKDVAVVEGMMGLFDGYDGKSEAGSTAEMARRLDLKVILVIDANALGRSAAAVIHGMRTFDPRVELAGVVFNRVSGPGHFEILADAVKDIPAFPFVGWLPPEPSIDIPERHLGLMTAEEQLPLSRISAITEFIERHLDVTALLNAAPEIKLSRPRLDLPVSKQRCRVALAHDAAFSFYYQANRLALESAGADIIEFSPLRDREIPDVELLYLGGGYPELYRDALLGNRPMLQSVRRFMESGKRCYAECGGLMYLAEAGLLPTAIEMTNAPVDFGYSEVTTRVDSIIGPAGTTARGHQFHFSRNTPPSANPVYQVRQRTREYAEGFSLPNGIASYVHLHFLSNLNIARNMLQS